jgi:hypothetical protein
VKIGVDFTRLNEARFAVRAAEIAGRRQRRDAAAPFATTGVEVTDGQRELGVAAGGVRQADE